MIDPLTPSDRSGLARGPAGAARRVPEPRAGAEEQPPAPAGLPGAGNGADGDHGWFLPGGRAALLPGGPAEVADGAGADRRDEASPRAAGAPPWSVQDLPRPAGTPPPWETGPWPGPGGEAGLPRPRPVPSPPAAPPPGQPGPELAGRMPRRMVAAAAAAVVLIAALAAVIATAVSGGPGGCVTYPAAVRQAYGRAMSDVTAAAPAAAQTADFAAAASRANSAAAAAGQGTGRVALDRMASDLAEAHTAVAAGQPLDGTALLKRLRADGTALPASCPG